jgi:phenylalanyl-tRNA synthetase beta chain
MKFTLGWLRDHLDTGAPLTEITEALTDLGHEVEGVEDPGAKLGAFTIARVIEAVQHPNADRLRVCRVATYPGGPGTAPVEVQVVCGAPNARTGLVGVFAPPGTHVPGTGLDLKPGVIRGVESNGMLCSERELMLSDAHDGIIELPADAPLGARFIDWRGLNDPVIEVKITPNRPDALGVRGIARDLAARGLGTLKAQDESPVAGTFPCPIAVRIDEGLKARGCPHFTARLIRGVRNGPSPDWLAARLRAVGLRPISTLVDITNYFTIGLSRPLHVFDAARVAGALRIHAAAGGEELLALDGKTYRMAPGQMLISDDAGPESLAGIMGGAQSGVTEATVDVILESAWWDPITIAATGRALKINSDARYRFERGVDPAFTRAGLEMATRMILDLCGGEASEVSEDGAPLLSPRSYRFDPGHAARLVGMAIPEAAQRASLAALGFAVEGDRVSPPTWRPDVQGEADIVEEVARIASLTKLQGAPMARPVPGVPRPILTEAQRRERAVRRTLAGLGYNECVTYSFITGAAAAAFGGGREAVRVENPISSEMTHLRPDLLPGLLAAAGRNQARGFMDLALFEVGPVFAGGEPGEQEAQAAALLIGDAAARDPHGSRRPVDGFDAKADAEAVLAALGAPARAQVGRAVAEWWHPGRSGAIGLGPVRMAVFGAVHPRVLASFGIKGPAVALTVWPDAVPVPKAKGPTRPALTLSDYQSVERDFAFVVDAKVEAAVAVGAAQGADKALIAQVRVFDQFAGETAEAQMGAGKKSIALTVRLQPTAGTLTEAEIDAVSARVVEKVTKATGGTLRAG